MVQRAGIGDWPAAGNAILAAPSISGAVASFATGPLAYGPHTLAGTLVDLAGRTAAFTTHLTIVSGPAPADWPYVEMNAFAGVSATLGSTDGGATATIVAPSTGSSDHLVIRIDPNPPAVVGGGFSTGSLVYDVSCYWSQTGVEVHAFTAPIEIVLSNPTNDPTLVPATFENGTWRPLPLVPSAGVLPAGWNDGFYAGSGGIHVLTRHLSEFTLLHDRFPPPPPRDVNGVVASDGLTLRWAPGFDPVGPIHQVQLYVDGTWVQNFDTTQFETKIGRIAAGDPRTFVFTEDDFAGNVSAPTIGLRALPQLAGLSVAAATQALDASGFLAGTITRVQSSTPVGTVVGPAGVQVLPLGSAVDLTVSGGPAARFTLRALAPRVFRPTHRRTMPSTVAVTGSATATATLVDARGHLLGSWQRRLAAGVNHPRLRLTAHTRRLLIDRPGSYWLTWAAKAVASVGDHAADRIRVRVVRR